MARVRDHAVAARKRQRCRHRCRTGRRVRSGDVNFGVKRLAAERQRRVAHSGHSLAPDLDSCRVANSQERERERERERRFCLRV